MKILLLYPEFPTTFWSFKYALRFISKKSSHPPLGLITISAMLPETWEKRLVDLNVNQLLSKDIDWADMIFISAMSIQRSSVKDIIVKCHSLGKIIVAGGPLFTEDPEAFDHVDHLILNEAEVTLPQFLNDLKVGKPKNLYSTTEYPDISNSIVPDYSLLDFKKYATMSLQLSRGCPFNCEFCEITGLFGTKVRLKSSVQIIAELNRIYENNWKGEVFFVDDNFIGNRRFLKQDLLPKLIKWMEVKKYPFRFITEASINLADDDELMSLMVSAGFMTVFIGIETPDEDSLKECSKVQNNNRDLLDSIHKIQDRGIMVMGGFIVGFDNDSSSIFKRQIDFIKKSGIISAMVGLLNAPPKTKLYARLLKENRIVDTFSGNNTDLSINFIPKMDLEELKNGYLYLIRNIYSCKPYYKRVREFLKRYQKNKLIPKRFTINDISALFRSIFVLGIFRKGRRHFWGLFFWSLFKRPQVFSLALTYSIYGYHFRRVFDIK